MNNKVKCETCDSMILPATADKNGGICMPCYKQANTPVKVLPERKAFYMASVLLLLNVIFGLIMAIALDRLSVIVFSYFIDIVLIILLLGSVNAARVLVLMRAVLGFFFFGILGFASAVNVAVAIESLVVQALFAGALFLLLAWETTEKRFWGGVTLSGVCAAYLLLATIITVVSKT